MVHPEFEVHLLNFQGKMKAHTIAEEFDKFLSKLEEIVPSGRELSIVKTKLEEASFFAKKAVAKHKENQEPPEIR